MEILKQEDQWPDRVAAGKEPHENPWHHESSEDAFYYGAHGGPGSFYDGEVKKKPALPHNDNQYMRGEDTGLYGEDEDHTYDIIGRPSPDGKGFDVLKSFG